MTISIATFISNPFRRVAFAALAASMVVGAAVGPAGAAPGGCIFGECESAPAVKASSSEFKLLAKHGTWTAETNGKSTLITDRFDDGSRFGIVDKNDEISFVWFYDKWHWREGQTLSVKIDIDGHVFEGTLKAQSATFLVAANVKKDVMQALYNGRKVRMEVAGDTFTITGLSDAVATIDDAIRYQRTSAR